MPKRILTIGHCSYDHNNIAKTLKKHFDVELDAADTAEDATQAISQKSYDLILINRLFDSNSGSGIELIRKLKPTTSTPMMLISNYPDAHQEAITHGAVPGFGKKMVGKPTMLEVVKDYLK